MTRLHSLLLLAFAVTASAATAEPPAEPPSQAVARLEKPGAYMRHELRLPGVLRDGGDLLLYLGEQDGALRQAWAVMSTAQRANRQIYVDQLRLKDDRLTGQARVNLAYPGENRVYVADLTLDAKLTGGRWAGTFQSEFAQRGPMTIAANGLLVEPSDLSWSVVGGRMLRGEVHGSVEARARAEGAVTATVETDCLFYVHAHVARWGKAQIDLRLRDGTLTEVKVEPRRSGAGKWQAKVVGHEAQLTEDRLAAMVDIEVTGDAVRGGRHTLKLDGELVGNTIAGEADSYQDGKRVNTARNMLGHITRTDPPAHPDALVVTAVMPDAVSGSRTPTLALTVQGERMVTGAVRGYLRKLGKADVSKLKREGNRITGKATLHFPVGSALVWDEDEQATYELDLRWSDGELTGTYAGKWGQARKVEAKLTGVARSEQAWREAHRLQDAYAWPCFAGPNPSLTADSRPRQLVEKLSDARLLWASERTMPGRCQVARYGESNLGKWLREGPASGGGTPIIYDGKVYFFYVRPGSTGPLPDIMAGFEQKKQRTMALLWARHCDDVVLCLDAATGQTLWKSVLPDVGLYEVGKGKRGAYTAWLCAGEGRVFVTGSNGQLRCHNARTGEIEWSVPNGESEVASVIDGVLVAPGGPKLRGGLRALDVRDGKVLWAVENVASRFAQPLAWTHNGKTWVIANCADRVHGIDLRSGKVQWSIKGLGEQANGATMSIGGDVLIVEADRDQAPKDVPVRRLGDPIVRPERIDRVMVAYRLAETEARPLWVLDERYHANRTAPPYRDGLFFYRNVTTGKLYALNAETGKVVSRADCGSSGTVQVMNDRVFVLRDPSHGHTEFNYYAIGEKGQVRPLEIDWHTMHLSTTGYWPIVGAHAMADGRWVLRGARGIFCYDSRRPQEGQ